MEKKQLVNNNSRGRAAIAVMLCAGFCLISLTAHLNRGVRAQKPNSTPLPTPTPVYLYPVISHQNDRHHDFLDCTPGHLERFSIGVLNPGTWTAAVTSGSPWLTIVSPAVNTGDGFVIYTVAQNPYPYARTGTIDISGQVFTVTQTASEGSNPCPVRVGSAEDGIMASKFGNYFTIPLNDLGRGMSWIAEVDPLINWVALSPLAGTGAANTYAFIDGNSGNHRIATVKVAGKVIPIVQP